MARSKALWCIGLPVRAVFALLMLVVICLTEADWGEAKKWAWGVLMVP